MQAVKDLLAMDVANLVWRLEQSDSKNQRLTARVAELEHRLGLRDKGVGGDGRRGASGGPPAAQAAELLTRSSTAVGSATASHSEGSSAGSKLRVRVDKDENSTTNNASAEPASGRTKNVEGDAAAAARPPHLCLRPPQTPPGTPAQAVKARALQEARRVTVDHFADLLRQRKCGGGGGDGDDPDGENGSAFDQGEGAGGSSVLDAAILDFENADTAYGSGDLEGFAESKGRRSADDYRRVYRPMFHEAQEIVRKEATTNQGEIKRGEAKCEEAEEEVVKSEEKGAAAEALGAASRMLNFQTVIGDGNSGGGGDDGHGAGGDGGGGDGKGGESTARKQIASTPGSFPDGDDDDGDEDEIISSTDAECDDTTLTNEDSSHCFATRFSSDEDNDVHDRAARGAINADAAGDIERVERSGTVVKTAPVVAAGETEAKDAARPNQQQKKPESLESQADQEKEQQQQQQQEEEGEDLRRQHDQQKKLQEQKEEQKDNSRLLPTSSAGECMEGLLADRYAENGEDDIEGTHDGDDQGETRPSGEDGGKHEGDDDGNNDGNDPGESDGNNDGNDPGETQPLVPEEQRPRASESTRASSEKRRKLVVSSDTLTMLGLRDEEHAKEVMAHLEVASFEVDVTTGALQLHFVDRDHRLEAHAWIVAEMKKSMQAKPPTKKKKKKTKTKSKKTTMAPEHTNNTVETGKAEASTSARIERQEEAPPDSTASGSATHTLNMI